MPIHIPKIFLDSGNPEETRKTRGILGFLDGQTTNPTLVAKHPEVVKFLSQGKKLTEKELFDFYKQIIKEICKYIAGPVSAEVYADWDVKASEMLKQAEEMNSWGRNIYVKFPVIPEGLKAAHQFVKKGGRVNMTLVFDQNQAAAAYSATLPILTDSTDSNRFKLIPTSFVSPFIGRLDDRGYDGLDLVKNIIKMYKKFNKKLNKKKPHILVLAASVRTLEHFYAAIFMDVDIITAPLKLLDEWVRAEKWIPDSSYRLPPNGLKSIICQDIPYYSDFIKYGIEKSEGSLLDEGLKKFVKDWKSLLDK